MPSHIADGPSTALTSREKEILEMLAQGLASKLIASALSISEHTVRAHTKSIYRKLQVTNRVQAVLAFHKELRTSLNSLD